MLQGEREMASANKSLGRFDLTDIPGAPRGVPQVEVTFDIDANGILNVSAKDKSTGKAQSIVIRASTGLSEEEIQKMVMDAEAHKEDDRKFHELVGARNQADALVHSVSKSLTDAGDKVPGDERAHIEAALNDLKDAMKGNDKENIEARTQALSKASEKLASMQGQSGPEVTPDAAEAAPKKSADDIVDAEFEEIKK